MCIDHLVYKTPEPALVARIANGYGFENACERWAWAEPATVAKWVTLGNAAKAGRPSTRKTTQEQEERIIADAIRLNSYNVACLMHGVSTCLVVRLFRERGLQPPTMTNDQLRVHLRRKTKFRELIRLYAVYKRGLD